MHVCVPHECPVPAETRRMCQIPRNWSCRWLWVLGTNRRSSVGTVHPLNLLSHLSTLFCF